MSAPTVDQLGEFVEHAEKFKTEIEDARLGAQQADNEELAGRLGEAASHMEGVISLLGDAESYG